MSKNSRSKNSKSASKEAAQRKNTASVNNTAAQPKNKSFGNAAKQPKNAASAKRTEVKKAEVSGKPVGHFLSLIPIVLVLGYLPAVMRTVVYKTNLADYEWFTKNNTELVDVFLKSKANFLIVIAVLMLIIMVLWAIVDGRSFFRKFDKLFIFLGIAAVFTIISAIASSDKGIVLIGTFENFESLFVILSYFVVCVYTYLCFLNSKDFYRDLQFIYRCALPGFLYTSVIGIFQIFGKDLFATDLGKMLFTSSDYWKNLSAVNIVINGEYTTLHNPDYVATFMGMWVPILIFLFIMTKAVLPKIIRAALCVLTLVDLFGARTLEGILGFVFAAFFVVLIVSLRNKKVFIGLLCLSISAVIVVLAIPKTRDKIAKEFGVGSGSAAAKARFIDKLYTYDDRVEIEIQIQGERYALSYDLSTDGSGKDKLNVYMKGCCR